MPPYSASFPRGTRIRIVDRDALETFKAEWKYHDPLTDDQLSYAGAEDTVRSLGYYHGGDVLYWLERTPGTWHEVCLVSAEKEQE